MLHGLGRLIESNYLYKGFWLNGKRNGYGIEKFINGNSYNGEFLDDKKHGNGKYVNAGTGTTYDGAWFNNKRHGIGKFNCSNGDEYFGEW